MLISQLFLVLLLQADSMEGVTTKNYVRKLVVSRHVRIASFISPFHIIVLPHLGDDISDYIVTVFTIRMQVERVPREVL